MRIESLKKGTFFPPHRSCRVLRLTLCWLRCDIGVSRHRGTRRRLMRVELIGEDYEDPSLRPLFTSAEMLHANFYHGFLDADRFQEQRELTRQFVDRVLAYTD